MPLAADERALLRERHAQGATAEDLAREYVLEVDDVRAVLEPAPPSPEPQPEPPPPPPVQTSARKVARQRTKPRRRAPRPVLTFDLEVLGVAFDGQALRLLPWEA